MNHKRSVGDLVQFKDVSTPCTRYTVLEIVEIIEDDNFTTGILDGLSTIIKE